MILRALLLIMMIASLSQINAREVIPISVTTFKVASGGSNYTVNLAGKEFIVVSVREVGSDGRFYAVDATGTVWWTGPITSGADDFKTPSGIYSTIYKKRRHMSRAYPSDDGINNMDYSIFFTPQGHALHKGSVDWMSRGCIHIDPKDIQTIYRWARPGTRVVITRHSYIPFARPDLLRYNLK